MADIYLSFQTDFSHGKEARGWFSCLMRLEMSSQLINIPQTGNVALIWAAGFQPLMWWSERLCACVHVCMCVLNRKVQWRYMEVRSDEGWWMQKGREAHCSRSWTSVFPHSRRVSLANLSGNAQSKHCSTWLEQTLLSWVTQTGVILFLCIASHCLPATCTNKWSSNIC